MNRLAKLGLVALVGLLVACGKNHNNKQVLPRDCVPEDFRFHGKGLILLNTPDAPQNFRLYGIKNLSAQNIVLDHIKVKAGVGAGWSSELTSNNWSAILLADDSDFSMICHDLDKEPSTEINCQDVLLVCRFTHADLSKAQKGSYWVSENLPLSKLLGAMEARSIGLEPNKSK